jgi:hypothetical protein
MFFAHTITKYAVAAQNSDRYLLGIDLADIRKYIADVTYAHGIAADPTGIDGRKKPHMITKLQRRPLI